MRPGVLYYYLDSARARFDWTAATLKSHYPWVWRLWKRAVWLKTPVLPENLRREADRLGRCAVVVENQAARNVPVRIGAGAQQLQQTGGESGLGSAGTTPASVP
jgi:hypothetical protein